MTRHRLVQAAIPVLMKDGTSRKIPRDRAEVMLRTGEVKQFISNTIYRAMQLGIEIKDFNDRDENAKLRDRISEIKEKAAQDREKKEKPKDSSDKKRQLPLYDKKNKNVAAV